MKKYIVSFAAALVSTLAVILVFSIVQSFMNVPILVQNGFNKSIGIFSSSLAALFYARGSTKRGYLAGMAAACVYTLLFLAIGTFIFRFDMTVEQIIMRFVYCLIFGAVAGIVGINIGK